MAFACARRERLGLPVVERNVEKENLDVEAVERANWSADCEKRQEEGEPKKDSDALMKR